MQGTWTVLSYTSSGPLIGPFHHLIYDLDEPEGDAPGISSCHLMFYETETCLAQIH